MLEEVSLWSPLGPEPPLGHRLGRPGKAGLGAELGEPWAACRRVLPSAQAPRRGLRTAAQDSRGPD